MIHWVSKMWGGILQSQARSQRYRRAMWQGQKNKVLDDYCKKRNSEHAIYVHFKCVHLKNTLFGDFLGNSVVKNLPANAEDMGSIPGLGRSHMLPSS